MSVRFLEAKALPDFCSALNSERDFDLDSDPTFHLPPNPNFFEANPLHGFLGKALDKLDPSSSLS